MATALLYDADCGFCRWSMVRILSWDRRGRLRPVALQDPEADRLLSDVDPERRMDSWHLVIEDGRVLSAGRAIPHLLRLLPGGRPLASVAAAFPGTTEGAYRLVAANRHRLGRLLGQKKCSVDPLRRASPRRPSRGR